MGSFPGDPVAILSPDEAFEELKALVKKHGRRPGKRATPHALYYALRRRFGTFEKAWLAAGGAPTKPQGRRWSVDAVIKEMRRLSRRGVLIRTSDLKALGREDLLGAATKYLGSLTRARRMARVPEPPRKPLGAREPWDEQRVIEEILTRHRDGEPLAYSKAPASLTQAGAKYFETWKAAIEAAGFDYDQIRLVRKPYTKEEILDQLRDLAAKKPTMTLGELHGHPIRQAVTKHFSSMKEAAQAADLQRWPKRTIYSLFSRKEVLAGLRKRHREDKKLYTKAIAREDSRLANSIALHFGNLPRALKAARLASDSPRRWWTKDAILAALRARRRKKLSLRPVVMLREEPGLFAVAVKHFDSYYDAARRVGPTPWIHKRWTKELVLEELRRVAASSVQITRKRAGHKLTNACIRYFSSYTAACDAAGVRPARRWRGASPGRPRR